MVFRQFLLRIVIGIALALGVLLAFFLRLHDQQLEIRPTTIQALRSLRAEEKFTDLPGRPAAEERRRLEPLMNEVLDRLIAGIEANPRKSWVIGVMEPAVASFHLEDTEARERCVAYLKRMLTALGIQNTFGAFLKYLIFI